MILTSVFERNLDAYLRNQRIIINQGGTRSSKSYSTLQLLAMIGFKTSKKLIISVVSQSMPHLKKGVIRDFKKIIQDDFNENFENNWNATDKIFTFPKGTILEFFSADQPDKVRGPARDILFINECDKVSFETFQQLAQRTRKNIFLDFNPVRPFWVMKEIIPHREHTFIHSTYLDNLDNLTPEIIKEIEENKRYKNWWRIYGEGLIGFAEDLPFQEADLNRFKMEDIDLRDASAIAMFIDTADKGEDNYSAPIGAVIGRDVYIFDVIFNKRILGQNESYTTEKIRKHAVTNVMIETNKEGSYFLGKMIDANSGVDIKGIFNTGYKHSRIMAQADYIVDRFHFLEDIKPKSEYALFFANLTEYSQTEKNEHDDAPDSLSGLAKYCRNYLEI